MQAIDRFFAKVSIIDDGCWLWQSVITHDGYGRFRLDGRMSMAHRVSYEWFVGVIPDNMCLDHLCRVRNCVNPEHLEVVTLQENINRGNTGLHESIKIICPKNHEYSEDNTKIVKGSRNCRECHRIANRNYYWRQKVG